MKIATIGLRPYQCAAMAAALANCGRVVSHVPFSWDDTGSLVVPKNVKTKGSHPQPYYRKGRW